MKARIEKKLSKRLVQLAPTRFKDSWIDPEVTERAENQGSRVSHCPVVGGGVDYFGEGMDWYTVWDSWQEGCPWVGDFPYFPQGHEFAGMPDTRGFRRTTRNILAIAAKAEAKAVQREKERDEWRKSALSGVSHASC